MKHDTHFYHIETKKERPKTAAQSDVTEHGRESPLRELWEYVN